VAEVKLSNGQGQILQWMNGRWDIMMTVMAIHPVLTVLLCRNASTFM